MNKKILIIGGAVIALIIIIIGGILIFRKPAPTPSPTPVDCVKDPTNKACPQLPNPNQEANLTMWGVFDDGSIFQPLISAFNKQYPNIKITYVKKSYSDYEATMVDAIASDTGPDIFNVSNFWLPKHKSKMASAPQEVFSAQEFNQGFIQSAYDDFVSDGKVYGVPLYTDNLVLYYNKRLMAKDSLYEPPQNWNDVVTYSKILTKKVPGGSDELTQAGIALGTSSITRSADILTAMMLQTGTPIISDDKRSFNFNQFRKNAQGSPEYPGTNALSFYTSFADPSKASYSWNDSFGDPVNAFAQEKVAMIVGYSYFASLIERANPTVSYDIAPLPQIKGAPENVDFVNYWGWSVSNRSKNQTAAWLFLKFLTEKEQINNYLQATGRTSPQKNTVGASNKVFDGQKYYAKTIFKGNAENFDQIFTEMIDDVVKYKQPNQSAIDTAARKANEMLSKYY
ncbi:MAG: sugar ABC transporter substrate-binding protein [Patescibacteria group bacterium]|nr:sugar ABC transporter substrate-binding protein [Patescibacteria group bacterium]